MSGRGRVLVTGASGFIGRATVKALHDAGYDVRAAARAPTFDAPKGVEAVLLPDLAGPFDARPLVDGMDYVVHLAGLAHATTTIPEAVYQTVNCAAAAELARASAALGVKRFILVSSVRAQTGPAAAVPVREDQEPSPTDAYGRSKLAAERAVARAWDGVPPRWVVLRPVLVYGPGVKGNMALLLRLARSRWTLPFASLKGRRSLLSIGNFAGAIRHCLVCEQVLGGTFLVADGTPVTVAEILSSLRLGLGRRPNLIPFPAPMIKGALRVTGGEAAADRMLGDLVVDTNALSATGWRPIEATSDALARAIRGM